MYLSIDENPNCELTDARVFQERGEPRPITHVLRPRAGKEVWCSIISWNETGPSHTAWARKVDDSGDGSCYLVYGDRWGLRLKSPDCNDAWSLSDSHQWGEPFLLLAVDSETIRFAS
jgi:hypothetical protein